MKSTLEIFSENLRNKLIARRKTQADPAKYMNVTQALDEEKQRAFWHGLLSEIVVDVAGQVVRLLY